MEIQDGKILYSILPQFPVVVFSLCGSRRKPPRFIQMGPATSPDIFGLIGLKKGIIIPDMLLLVDRTGPYLPIPSIIIFPLFINQLSRWLGSVLPEMDAFQILLHLLFSVLLFWSEAIVVSWKTIFEGSEKSSNCEFEMWTMSYVYCLVATQIFLFSPRSLGKWANLTNSFQVGWNHQVVYIWTKKLVSFVAFWCILLDIKWHLNQQP